MNKIVKFHENTGHVQAEREPPLLQRALGFLAEYFLTASNKHIKHTSDPKSGVRRTNVVKMSLCVSLCKLIYNCVIYVQPPTVIHSLFTTWFPRLQPSESQDGP